MRDHKTLRTPSWLMDMYLEKLLKKYLRNHQVKITDVKIESVASNGNIYACLISRIKIEFTQQEENNVISKRLYFLLKHAYDSDPFMSDIMSGYYVYNTELNMYARVLPRLYKILREVGEREKLFAKTLDFDFERSAIIFEDLTEHYYVSVDHLKGLNKEQALMVLKKLAQFHAAAAVLNQRLNGELEKFQRGLFNAHTRSSGYLFENLIEVCAKFAGNCTDLGPYYHDKLMKIKPFIVDYSIRAYNNNPKHFNTLCHGDLWTNNIMFLYEPLPIKYKLFKEVLFTNFQFCNWSTPANDLHYFFHTSLESKLQFNVHVLNKMIQYYHGILVDVLRNLNFKGFIPTLRQLHIQLEEGKFLAFTAATVSWAILISDQNADTSFQSLLKDDEQNRKLCYNLFLNERLQSDLKILLPHFDRIGLLDLQ